MEKLVLNAFPRKELKVKVGALRAAGKVPAVLYGSGEKNENLFFSAAEFEKIHRQAGSSTLVDLKIDAAEPFKVLIYDWQKDALTDKFSHVDLYRVDMKKELVTEIPLVFIGESIAAKEAGNTLSKNLSMIEISCLPGDLVGHIDVDISVIKTSNDYIHVRDLNVPGNIKVLTNPDEVVASVVEIKEEAPTPVAAPTPEAVAAAAAAIAPVEEKKGEKKKEEKKK